MDEFNSDDYYIYYCEQETHRTNGVTLIINKSVQSAVLFVQPQKRQKDLGLFPRQTIQCHNNTRPSRANSQKRCPFHCRDWNANVGNQEMLRITGKLDLEYKMKEGKS